MIKKPNNPFRRPIKDARSENSRPAADSIRPVPPRRDNNRPARRPARPNFSGSPSEGGSFNKSGRSTFSRDRGGRRGSLPPLVPSNAQSTKRFRGLPTDAVNHKPMHSENGKPIVRFVPLGGLEEVGRNCSFFEYKNQIVVVDVGIQFPEEETPGVDYIIPNVTYLE